MAEPDAVERGSRRCRRSAGRARPAAPDGARPSARRRRASSRRRRAVSDDHDRRSRSRRGRRRSRSSGRGGSRTARAPAPRRRAPAGWRRRASSAGRRRPPRRRPPRGRPSARRRPPSERSATEIGASPSVDDPTRTSTADSRRAGSVTARSCLPLVVDAERRPRERLEPLAADRLAADSQRPYVPSSIRASAASISASSCCALSSSALVDLAVEGGVACRRGGCRRSRTASPRLVLERPGFSCRGCSIARQRRARAQLELLGTAAMSMLMRSRVVLSARRRRAAARSRPASRPGSSTTLSREVWPETTETAARGRPRRLGEQADDGVVRTAALGRGATRTFHASPCRPTSRRAGPGETRGAAVVSSARAISPASIGARASTQAVSAAGLASSASPRRARARRVAPRRAASSAARASSDSIRRGLGASALALGGARCG